MKTLKTVLAFWKYGFLSILAYRTSFLMQAVFMMINNAFILGIFILFFEKFGKLGGMTFAEYIPLYSIQVIIFGIVHTLFFGYEDISSAIRDGKLDNYLLTPKNPLIKILVSKMNFSAIGDFVSGFIFLAYFTPEYFLDIGFMTRLIIAVIIGSIAWMGIMIFYHSLGFYLGSSESISEWAFNSILGSSFYPPSIYEGTAMKWILLTVFPSFWICFYPYTFIVSQWNFSILWMCFAASMWFLLLGAVTFHRGLKRYESGNLMVTNS